MTTSQSEDDLLPLIVLATVTLFAVVVYIMFFMAGLVGVAAQLADPGRATEEANPAIFPVAFPIFAAFAFCILPEVPEWRRRLKIALLIAVAPSTLVPVVLTVTLLSAPHTSPSSYATTMAAVFVVFAFGLPLAITRAVVWLLPDLRAGKQGDHYIDADALSGDTRRIVAKHTNGSFKRPPALHRLTLWGDGGRLTHGDVLHLIELEIEELDRVTAHADAATRQAVAEFRRKRAEMLAAVSPEFALWLSEHARAGTKPNALLISPEDANG